MGNFVDLIVSKFMTHQSVSRFLLIVVAAMATLTISSSAFAQDDRETARDTGPVVRHQLLYRSTRLEVAPLAGMTVNDAYMRNAILGASLSYHLTNSIGLNVVGGYGVTQFGTDLRDNLENRLGDVDDISYSYVQALVGAELTYAPIIGKFSIFNGAITDFDIHLIGGFGFVFEAAEAAAEGGEVDPELEGLRPAPTLGIGTRFFLSDGMAATLQVRDYLYSRSEISTLTADPEFKNNVMVTLGLSFFLPQEVKISR